MKWTAIDNPREYGSVYVTEGWRIVHNTEEKTVGFGISKAALWKVHANHSTTQMGEWAGRNCLRDAMRASEGM